MHITGVKFKETICCTPIGRPQPNRRLKKGNLLHVCNAYNTENYLSKQNFSNIKNVCKYCSHIFFSCVFVCVAVVKVFENRIHLKCGSIFVILFYFIYFWYFYFLFIQQYQTKISIIKKFSQIHEPFTKKKCL